MRTKALVPTILGLAVIVLLVIPYELSSVLKIRSMIRNWVPRVYHTINPHEIVRWYYRQNLEGSRRCSGGKVVVVMWKLACGLFDSLSHVNSRFVSYRHNQIKFNSQLTCFNHVLILNHMASLTQPRIFLDVLVDFFLLGEKKIYWEIVESNLVSQELSFFQPLNKQI